MTIWDKIYQNYQQGGEVWASLAKDIHPLFLSFLEEGDFQLRYALDIGCGTGKYLKVLQVAGFAVVGVDSSPTAIEMTRDALGDDADLICADMFQFDIAPAKYDLIISIATIHHGRKKEVAVVINKIYNGLVAGGKIFITLPDMAGSQKWHTFQNNEVIEEGTFAPLTGPEKGLPHSFYTREEVVTLFSRFQNLQLELDDHSRWIICGSR